MRHLLIFTLVSLAVSGCGTPPIDKKTKTEQEAAIQNARAKMRASTIRSAEGPVTQSGRVIIPVVPSAMIESNYATAWLSSKKVSLKFRQPLPMNEVIRMFHAQGINIASTLPLENYTFGGYGVSDTDAETALRLVLSSVGLDYELDNIRRIVLIKPLQSKTWYLNLGNRSSSYSSGSSGSSSGQQQMGGSQNGTTQQVIGQGGSNQNANTLASSSGQQSGQSGSVGISSSDNFWGALRTELSTRLTVLVPNTSQNNFSTPAPLQVASANPAVPPPLNAPIPANSVPSQVAPAPARAGDSNALYVKKEVGTYSVNPETGAVTIQAPHWILEGLNLYLKRIQEMYNTELTFTGEIVNLTTDSNSSEGLDISSFGRFANTNYGLGFKNNSLGGVTISVPDPGFNSPLISATKTAVSGTLLGVTNLTNGLQVFNAYLSNHGSVSVMQKPILTTTSGVPVSFSKIATEYFNSVSQQATAGNLSGGTTATQNTMVPVDLGTIIKINPRIDVSTGLIRAQISFYHTFKSGTQTVNQYASSGNTLQQVNQEVPIVTKMDYQGEALLQDGDLIIVGGQQDDTGNLTSDGVTGLKDTIVGGIFGTKGTGKRSGTYYFAMRVTVHKRDVPPMQNRL